MKTEDMLLMGLAGWILLQKGGETLAGLIPKGPLIKAPDITLNIPQIIPDIPQIIPDIPRVNGQGIMDAFRAGLEAATFGIISADKDTYVHREHTRYPAATPEVQGQMWDFLEAAGFKTPRPTIIIPPIPRPGPDAISKRLVGKVTGQLATMKATRAKADIVQGMVAQELRRQEIVRDLSPQAAYSRQTAITSRQQHPLPTQKHMPTVERVSPTRTIIRRPLYANNTPTKPGGIIRRHDPNVHGN